MKKLLLMLLLLALPAVSLAQQDPGPEPRSFNSPGVDIFLQRADTCASTAANCGSPAGTPSNVINVINSPVFAIGFVMFRVPTTQNYTLFYLASDIEGSLNPATQLVQQGPFLITAGDSFSSSAQFSALAPGVYKFIAIIIGADGKVAISDPYRFRYCNVAAVCINGP